MPHTQHLGTPEHDHHQPRTAIDRVEHHLTATTTPNPHRNRATELLRQHNQLRAHLRDIATTTKRLDAITEKQRDRHRQQEHGNDLEL